MLPGRTATRYLTPLREGGRCRVSSRPTASAVEASFQRFAGWGDAVLFALIEEVRPVMTQRLLTAGTDPEARLFTGPA
jgi:hypothetical protein